MIKSKLIKGLYGKHRIIEGYKEYNKLYVHKINKKNFGYCVTDSMRLSVSDMIEIDGEYWFSTLKELHNALNKN